MPDDISILREAIRAQINEFKGLRDLVNVICRLQVRTAKENEPTVPDVLTNIRAQPGVVVVKQLGAIRRAKRGREHLDIEIKYMPETKDPYEFLDTVGKVVKNTLGVEIVRIITLGGHRTTRKDGRPWVF